MNVAERERSTSGSRRASDERVKRVVLVDPGLFTAPYDAALSDGLRANGIEPRWATRRLRLGEEDGLGAGAEPIFYPLTDGPNRRSGALWRALKGAEHYLGLRALRRLVAAVDADVVHFQWVMLPYLDRRTIACLRQDRPVVMTVHDVVPFNGKAVHRLQRDGVGAIWRAVDRLIVHTEGGREALIDAGIAPGRIAIVPHGMLGRAAAVPDRAPGRRWHIVQFGRIQAYKGIDLLVEAIGRLTPAVRATLTVIIAGEAQIDMTVIMQRASALGIDATCLEFRLWRHSRAEMDALFADADTFVFPYRAIEASGVLFEIALLGRWIVASDIGSFAELLGSGSEAGTLVPVADIASLASALEASIGRIPSQMPGTSVPNWNTIGAMTGAVYDDAIAERRDSAAPRQ